MNAAQELAMQWALKRLLSNSPFATAKTYVFGWIDPRKL